MKHQGGKAVSDYFGLLPRLTPTYSSKENTLSFAPRGQFVNRVSKCFHHTQYYVNDFYLRKYCKYYLYSCHPHEEELIRDGTRRVYRKLHLVGVSAGRFSTQPRCANRERPCVA